ncbi:lysoplasmalogenase [Altererythrobacter sp. H2]|uniref:lysoplasmalogenase n=1 Tax=Altererythrobacter sp. H2 TaxID=3108391 RepID=UPI002B4BAEF8|nr:lysoplasmalogenase [Altererythrobacter sp. H2]WRK94338.1 lysoplasmalogenase [Altererythrobacter sp. H2]
MSRAALIEHRPWLLASIVAAVAYYALSDAPLGGIQLMVLKALGVAFLAAYALRRAPGHDGRLIAIVMALGAVGDAAIEVSFIAGGSAFFLGHLVAIGLYLRNRRAQTTASQRLAAVALLVATPLIAWLLSRDAAVALYSVALGAMAAAAWSSRFGRYRVGTGAVLFVVSDWLIFTRMGPIGENLLADWLIWPLYYSGQFLIATGVVQALRRHTPRAA